MAKGLSLLLIRLVLMAVSVSSQQAGLAQKPVQCYVVPLKKFPKDQRFETVSGDPTKSGALYVIRIYGEAGYIIMPHTHPEDENIVVVKGSWAVGMGDHFNRQALEPMEVGTYGMVPKKMPHFAFSRTDTIIQVHGIGPFTTHWVVPMYELTDKANGWVKSNGEPVLNQDLLDQLDQIVQKHDIQWEWTAGHRDHADLNRAHQLALQAARAKAAEGTR